ncbi:RlpA-like double-psi beta-barrel-protein domain-containing protein-containing protein [Bombardia bombarda]|uniref:RlpA-like double-psi beta-barrel-protein domain-containing protein-containing protein n=1 Tax=Bombardia bombarda TaxID=252184 RepID=A0AA40C7Z3_9PEZI|nr:RlpA-like double-psi beta-barrel-protein domain-containing protein-containing protein [Bombardia bombarda]
MQDGNAGSCGEWNDDDSYIVALGNDWMQWQYEGPECGRQVRVKNLGSDYGVGGEGNSIIATVADTCDSCDATHVDFSVGAWNALTDHSEWSQLNIQW